MKEYQKRDTEPKKNLKRNQSKNLTINTSSKSSEMELLKSYGISGQLADDFIQHRKAKKLAITTTVLNGFQREAVSAGKTLTEAITVSIERGWQGFKAEWFLNKNQVQRTNQKQPMQRPDYGDYEPLDENFNSMPLIDGERVS